MSGGSLRLVWRPEPVQIGEAGICSGLCVPARLPQFRLQPGAAAAGQSGPVQLLHQTFPLPGKLITRSGSRSRSRSGSRSRSESRSGHGSSSSIRPLCLQDAALNNQTLVGPVLGSSVANLSISNLTECIQFTIRNVNPAQVSWFCPSRRAVFFLLTGRPGSQPHQVASCAFWDFSLNGEPQKGLNREPKWRRALMFSSFS